MHMVIKYKKTEIYQSTVKANYAMLGLLVTKCAVNIQCFGIYKPSRYDKNSNINKINYSTVCEKCQNSSTWLKMSE